MTDLSKVSIGIKTFLRDSHLFDAIAAIRCTMPEVEMVIVDDGRPSLEKTSVYRGLDDLDNLVLELPFDSGFGFKSNKIAELFRREYLLIASDDFDFHPPSVVRGIEKLVEVLDHNPGIDIASGRVNGNPYEFDLEDLGDKIIEHPTIANPHIALVPWYIQCDLTVNYSLMRRSVFAKVGWDNDVKIGGGEHGAFFVDAKRAGLRTVYVPGVSINEQRKPNPPEYRAFRSRASCPDRPCFVKRGIRTYILGNGQVDYQEGK